MFNEIRKLMSPDQNRWNFRYVIVPLALVALSVPIYAFTLIFNSLTVDIPEALLSLGSTALGALAGFLTHYTQRRENGRTETQADSSAENEQPPPKVPLPEIALPNN